jgi:glutamate-1-semialdehyde 2,1-aminomutase
MYGHMNASLMTPGHPQFMARGDGARIWDVDGNCYIDLMCGWGPVILGRRHPDVDRAARRALEDGDCLNGATPAMVELAELLVETIAHADWALFAKNGTDATTLCLTVARAATGRRKILVANGAYHGAAPWCTPRTAGVVAEDRAHLIYYEYNDVASVQSAAQQAEDDLAAIIVCPVRQDTSRPQELPHPDFARALRMLCDTTGAALVMDEVRCGFRLDLAGSWESLEVRPDLAAWSKALANGYPLAAVTGSDWLRSAATEVFATGSFWFSGFALAAALATIRLLGAEEALPRMHAAGDRLRAGLANQAASHGFAITQTGPVEMPLLAFADDPDHTVMRVWAELAACHGVYLHPTHNWFLSTAHTDAVIDEILDRTDRAFNDLSNRLQ